MLEEKLALRLASLGSCFPIIAPLGTKPPYMVYTKISNSRQYTLTGFSGLTRQRIQINCVDSTYAGAKTLTDQVVNELESWPNKDDIQVVIKENEIDTRDEVTKLYVISVDFMITYRK